MDESPALLLCVGQCGIQLGTEYMETELSRIPRKKEHISSSIILVDSESKVIKRESMRLKTITDALLDEKSIIITGKGGSGNSWARGKMMGTDPFLTEGVFSSYCSMGERVIECLRRPLEKSDSLSGTILLHSLGGGTGSGLGSHLLELYRDELPKKYLYSVAVVPHSSGDSPLQNYNCLLSIPAIHEYADACVLLANDDYGNDVSSATNSKSQSYSVQDINAKFSRSLLGLIHPAFDKDDQISQLKSLMTGLSPDKFHKFISLHQISSKTASLRYLLKQVLTQKLKLHSTDAREHIKTFSSVLVARGIKEEETNHFRADSKEQVKRFLFPKQDHIKTCEIFHNFNSFPYGERSSVTLALNSSLVTDFFKQVMTKSQRLISHGAYLHWYERFGITKESFLNSLEILEKLNVHYNGLI